mmetsp:Transcript_56800/g.143941  ORF Transcript_56800/g.143941 Transcript_56800/m.143941 type:complete len:277 (+) Transcript_56800:899-1729(+)
MTLLRSDGSLNGLVRPGAHPLRWHRCLDLDASRLSQNQGVLDARVELLQIGLQLLHFRLEHLQEGVQPWCHPDHPVIAEAITYPVKLHEGPAQQVHQVEDVRGCVEVQLPHVVLLALPEGPGETARLEAAAREVLGGLGDAPGDAAARLLLGFPVEGLAELSVCDREASLRHLGGSTGEEPHRQRVAQKSCDDGAAAGLPGALHRLLQRCVRPPRQQLLALLRQGVPQSNSLHGREGVGLLQIRRTQQEVPYSVRQQVPAEHQSPLDKFCARAVAP